MGRSKRKVGPLSWCAHVLAGEKNVFICITIRDKFSKLNIKWTCTARAHVFSLEGMIFIRDPAFQEWKEFMNREYTSYFNFSVELFFVVQSLNHARLFVTPWTETWQVSLSFTISWSFHKLMPIELVMPSNHLILCCPLLLPPSIRVFSNESALHIRWPKDWSFSFNISPSNGYSGLTSFKMDWLDLLAVQGNLRVLSNTTVQKHPFFGAYLSFWSNSHIHTWLLEITELRR